MRAGAPRWGGPPGPPSCGAASGHPVLLLAVLLLAVLGLLSIPVARGEYGGVGRTRDTCLDPTWLLRGWVMPPPSLGTDPWLGAVTDPALAGAFPTGDAGAIPTTLLGWGRGQGTGSSPEEVFSCHR